MHGPDDGRQAVPDRRRELIGPLRADQHRATVGKGEQGTSIAAHVVGDLASRPAFDAPPAVLPQRVVGDGLGCHDVLEQDGSGDEWPVADLDPVRQHVDPETGQHEQQRDANADEHEDDRHGPTGPVVIGVEQHDGEGDQGRNCRQRDTRPQPGLGEPLLLAEQGGWLLHDANLATGRRTVGGGRG